MDPRDTLAESKAADCRAAKVTGRSPSRRHSARSTRARRPQAAPTSPAANPAQDAQLAKLRLKQARQSYIAGKHSLSIAQAREVLKLSPGNTDAVQIIGAASCYLKQQAQARWAFGRLRPASRQLVRNICVRNGINLE